MSPALHGPISIAHTLTTRERNQVESIGRAATLADGVSPLDNRVRLDLQYGDESARHLLVRRPADDTVIGYGHLRFADAAAAAAEPAGPRLTAAQAPGGPPPVGHLVVDPRFRRAGLGAALLARMQETAPHGLRVWAHGDLPPARQLAAGSGFERVRDLWRMHRDLDAPLEPPAYPPDVTVRSFAVGRDEAAWLALNAASFADHLEQGSVTADGFAQRLAQPDFDPAGFFLVERGEDLLGFHWTKVHPAGDFGPDPVGEVHVLGVHPETQGLGLGKALTLTGLRFLQSRRLGEVILYVEGDNAPAVAVYTRLGFTRVAVDVLYASEPAAEP